MEFCSYCWHAEQRKRPGPYVTVHTDERIPLCGYHLALLGMGKLEQA